MEFTYDAYRGLLDRLKRHGYQIANYRNWRESSRCVILRHDIDNDIGKAVRMARMERIGGATSTYFVLLTSPFYNVFSKESSDGLKRIIAEGHTVGLHFDEARYLDIAGDAEAIKERILEEADLLGRVVGSKVDVVSMHRPSRFVLEGDIQIPGMINSYGQTYFKEFKYLSDSRMRWREPIDEIIESEEHERLHILTHAFGYHETEKDIRETVLSFINSGNYDRYQAMRSNITDLASIMSENEIVGGNGI